MYIYYHGHMPDLSMTLEELIAETFDRWFGLGLFFLAVLMVSLEWPGMCMFQFRSRCSWTSLTSSESDLRCFANRHAKVVTESTNSSATSNNN